MACRRVDHVALWVDDPPECAEFCLRHLNMHIIDQTDAFALVGVDARLGKLTFFAAEGERASGALERVILYCASIRPQLARLAGRVLSSPGSDGVLEFIGPEGQVLGLVETPDKRVGDLARITLRMRRPMEARRAFAELGFVNEHDRLVLGDTELEVLQRTDDSDAAPRLNHIGLLVDSADAEAARASGMGFEIERTVDAANTRAVFVNGPEGVLLEYVEHKPEFALN